ncbi:MAG: LysR family transcriptional regulator [Myxococcota bacterium]
MDLQHLRTFQVVAREGGFTAAARALGLSQSTLSESIRRLEEQLGTQLFLRTRSGVRPTESGQLLLDRSPELFGLVTALTDDLRDLQRGDRGKFVLGCHDQLGSYFLPAFLGDFLREHPQIELDLVCGSSATVRQGVLDRSVQFGLVVNTAPHPDLVIVPAFRDRIQLFGRGPAAPDALAAADRVRGAMVAVPDRAPFAGVLDALVSLGVAPARVVRTGDLGSARALAAAGAALAVLPWRVADNGHGLVAVHPGLPSFDDRIDLVWRADGHRTRAAARVREAVLAAARRLPPVPHGHDTVSIVPTAVSTCSVSSSID